MWITNTNDRRRNNVNVTKFEASFTGIYGYDQEDIVTVNKVRTIKEKEGRK